MNPENKQAMQENMVLAGVDFNLLAQIAECLAKRLPQILPQDRFGLTHSDIHPANIIVNSRRDCVHGICDWMTGTVTAQSIDFAGLGIARGLLPKVVRAYRKLEMERRVDKRVSAEAIYAFAAMRQIFVTVKALKHGYLDGAAARIAWGQVRECLIELGKLNKDMYGDVARKIRRSKLPVLQQPIRRSALASRPSVVQP
jgi:aminoglycoside phosphotransferase (APT) family kinase protein